MTFIHLILIALLFHALSATATFQTVSTFPLSSNFNPLPQCLPMLLRIYMYFFYFCLFRFRLHLHVLSPLLFNVPHWPKYICKLKKALLWRPSILDCHRCSVPEPDANVKVCLQSGSSEEELPFVTDLRGKTANLGGWSCQRAPARCVLRRDVKEAKDRRLGECSKVSFKHKGGGTWRTKKSADGWWEGGCERGQLSRYWRDWRRGFKSWEGVSNGPLLQAAKCMELRPSMLWWSKLLLGTGDLGVPFPGPEPCIQSALCVCF